MGETFGTTCNLTHKLYFNHYFYSNSIFNMIPIFCILNRIFNFESCNKENLIILCVQTLRTPYMFRCYGYSCFDDYNVFQH